jgi:transcriptional regulator NrdR family protein
MDTIIKKLEALLTEKKYDEVHDLIKEIVSTKMTSEEKGAALVNFASVYLELSNTINAHYLDALEEAVAGMKEINTAEAKSNDTIRVAELRETLANK